MSVSNIYEAAANLVDERYPKDNPAIRNAIIKSLLHDCIFQSLHANNLLTPIVFQGGTALQRIYNLPRFSEDLDFVCPHPETDFFEEFNQKFKASIVKTLSRYGIAADRVSVKSPTSHEVSDEVLKIKKWEMRIDVAGHGRYLRRDVVRVEIAHIPAEDAVQKFLEPFAPRYMQFPTVLLNVESEKEIMADKIVALCCRPYIKYRDIFDLYFLKERGVQYDSAMVDKKFEAYRVDRKKILEGLESKNDNLRQDGLEQYRQEMDRFLHAGWAGKEYTPWHKKALENAIEELRSWRKNIQTSMCPSLSREREEAINSRQKLLPDPNALVQHVVKEGLDPRELEKTMPSVDAGKLREELRKAADNPEGWGVSSEAFAAWGKKHGVGRKRQVPTPAGGRTEIVYDNF